MPDQFPAQEDTIRRFTVGHDDDGARLDRWFKRHMPQIGFNTISRWARTGQIRVDGKRAKPEDRIVAGQEIRVPPGGESLSKGPQRQRIQLTDEELAEADEMVLHRDRAAIVLNKPPGLATQGGTGTKHHVDRLLEAFVPEEDSKVPRPRLVHRLDKDTSGVLLTAATPGSAAFFSKRFSGRSAKKIYWALVTGVPDISAGTIDLALAKQPGTGGEKMMPDPEGQPARTKYRVVDRAGNRAAWVELEPLTGRTHQLRVHLAAIGHPIVGDGKYGGQAAFLTGSISRKMHLHARRLIIDHPDGTPLDVTAPLPDHFAASMQQLGFDENASAALPEEGPPPPSREDRKIAARRHAKDLRKERRGERRERTTGSPKPGKPTTKRSAAAAPVEKGGVKKGGVKKGKGSPQPAAKSSGKPPAGRPPGKAAGKPASRKPAPRKPAPRKPGSR